MIYIPVVYVKVHGPVIFADPEMAQRILGQHYSERSDVFVTMIKVRDSQTNEHIRHVKEADLRGPVPWYIYRLTTFDDYKVEGRPIKIGLELTDPKLKVN